MMMMMMMIMMMMMTKQLLQFLWLSDILHPCLLHTVAIMHRHTTSAPTGIQAAIDVHG
jgi:hypothetical protein